VASGGAKSATSLPHSPSLPAQLDPAPEELTARDHWECVHVDGSVVLTDSLADVTVRESTWEGVDLSGRRLTGFRAMDVVFSRCDFSGADLDGAQLTRVVFSGCRLTGTTLSGTQLEDVLVEDSTADFVNFRAAHTERLSIERTSLCEADFYEAKLTRSAILDSDLTGANFTKVSAMGLELFGSTLEDVHDAGALAGAHISGDQAIPMGALLLASLGIAVVERSR